MLEPVEPRAQLVFRVMLVRLVLLEMLAQLARQGFQVRRQLYLVQLVPLEFRAMLVRQVLLEQLEQLERQEVSEQLVRQDLKV
jgi:hypothetical protein